MIEPVGSSCNLNCLYCYQASVRDKKGIKIMPISLLGEIIPQVLKLGKSIRFLWHGGEPLLAGLDFFKEVVNLQQYYKKSDQVIENHIQTNATLINKSVAEFLIVNNFHAGTSLDGPEEVHNLTRNGSFKKVIQGIRNIQEAGGEVGIIITLNRHNVDYPVEIWENLIKPKKLARSWDINICTPTEISHLEPSPEKALFFLKTLFDLWLENDDPQIYIKTFWIILRALLGGRTKDCAFEYNKCRFFMAIDEDGNVYPCNRFLKRPVAFLGDIHDSSVSEILNNKETRIFYDRMSRLKPECKSCKWLNICGGGCPFQRWLSSGRFDGDFPECYIRKQFFSYIEEKIVKGHLYIK